MSEEKKVLTYKGHPLMRKDNMIYYGSMADSHIVMLQILETENVGGEEIAKRVSVQLQLTDPAAKPRDRIVKKAKRKVCSPHLISVLYGWKEPLPASNYSLKAIAPVTFTGAIILCLPIAF